MRPNRTKVAPLQDHNLASVYQQDLLAGVFYSIYGLNDLIFMLFFALVFFSQKAPGSDQ